MRPTVLLTAAAVALLAGCSGTSIVPTATTSAPASQTAAPAPPPPTTTPPLTSEPVGGTFTATTQNDNGDNVTYDVTLTQVVQNAQLGQYETLANSGDHMAAAEFSIKGDTGQASDDANNDAVAIGSDTTEYPSSTNSIAEGPNFSYGEWQVSPGQTVSGWVSFELPSGATITSVEWSAGAFSDNHATWTVG